MLEAEFLLQSDDPRLVGYYGANLRLSLAQCLEWAKLRVEGLNDALRDIPMVRILYLHALRQFPRVHPHDRMSHTALDIRRRSRDNTSEEP